MISEESHRRVTNVMEFEEKFHGGPDRPLTD